MGVVRGKYPGGNCPWWELSGGQLSEVGIVRGAIVQGAVVRRVIAQGGIVLEPKIGFIVIKIKQVKRIKNNF